VTFKLVAGAADEWSTRVESALDPASEVLAVRISAGAPAPLRAWVADPVREVLMALSGLAQTPSETRSRVTLLVSAVDGLAASDAAAHGAVVQAFRGIAQSITEEQPGTVEAVNVISHCGPTTDDIVQTVRYLDSPLGGNSAGSWIGLDQAAWAGNVVCS